MMIEIGPELAKALPQIGYWALICIVAYWAWRRI